MRVDDAKRDGELLVEQASLNHTVRKEAWRCTVSKIHGNAGIVLVTHNEV